MLRLRTFWESGLIGKLVLGTAGAIVFITFCCVALLIIGLLNPRPTAQTPTTAPSTVAPPTEAPTPITESPAEAPSPTTEPPTPIPTIVEPTATATPIPTTAPPTETPIPAATTVPDGYISHEMLGDDWPLRVEEGVIACNGGAIIFRAEGKVYAVNGTAKAQMDRQGWMDIRDITLPDPRIEGLLKNVQPIIFRGLDMCK